MILKQQIHHHFLQVITGRILQLENVLADLKESGSNETKSSAGDKHETSLAMLQIEQANTRKQLQEISAQLAAFTKIDPAVPHHIIANGSLVYTDKGNFYISSALGKVTMQEYSVTAVSPQSPLAIQFMGLKAGDSLTVNKRFYIIQAVA